MKLKKFLALCMSAAVTASAITTVMPAAAETSSQSNSITLFSDDFEGYPYSKNTDGLPLWYGSKNNGTLAGTYDNDYFKYHTGYAIDSRDAVVSGYKGWMTNGSLAKHIQFIENAGVGTGKAMNITSQGFSNWGGILKQSNITSDKINNKELVFSIDFKVDRMYYGEGYGIYFSEYNSSKDEFSPYQKEDAYPDILFGANKTDANKQLLLIAPDKKDGTPQIFAFGVKVGETDSTKAHNYTLRLVPDTNNGYRVYASLDETNLGEVNSSDIPSVSDLANFKYIMMSPVAHKSTIKNNAGVTNYENDKSIISLDNLKMTAEVIDNSVLFKDDFEGYPYSKNTDGLPLWYGSKNNGTLAGTYDNDYFKYHTGYAIDSRDAVVSGYKGWMTNGSLAKHIQFIENAGVGTGKAMNITSQGFSNWGGILKQSNITSDKINNKELVFSIDFKVDRMYYGEGYGIYFSEYNSSKDEFSPYQKEDAYPDILFGANKTDANKQLLLIAPDKKDGAPQIFAFGVKVGEADSTKAHNYTLRLIPNANNGYRVYASLDGTNLGEVNSSDIPRVSDLANFKYIMMSPVAHKSTIKNNAGVTSYENDKSIISLDNLSMITTEPVNMDGANVNGYAKVSGSAGSKTVTVKIMPKSGASVKPYIIAAVYNADGSLKDVKFKAAESAITAAQDLTVSGINAASESIKVFMWDGFANTKPLTTSVEL